MMDHKEWRPTYKWCFVPKCKNTTIKTPGKWFLSVPKKQEEREKWLKAARKKGVVSSISTLYCCEDHFDIENDVKNYMYVKLFHSHNRVKIQLKPGVLPTKFHCRKSYTLENFNCTNTTDLGQTSRLIPVMEGADQNPSLVNVADGTSCKCLLHLLIKEENFTHRLLEEKKSIVAAGRPMPDMTASFRETRKKYLSDDESFVKKYYDRYTWLTGCGLTNLMYCWPCVLFNTSKRINKTWSSSGFLYLSNSIPSCCGAHQTTPSHIRACIRLKKFERLNKVYAIKDKQAQSCPKDITVCDELEELNKKDKINENIQFIEVRCSDNETGSWSDKSTDENSEETIGECFTRHNSRKRISASLRIINNLVNKFRKMSDKKEQDNEFDVYCRSLAVQLKSMPLEQALLCQQRIHKTMIAERFGLAIKEC